MTREEAYKVVDTELDYQDKRWPKPKHSHNHTEFLVYIRSYVNEALEYVSRNEGDALAAVNMRKIAALAVSSMMLNGSPKREM